MIGVWSHGIISRRPPGSPPWFWPQNEYKLQVNKYDKKGCGGICEIVGLEEFQVKPYFDIDAKIDLDKSFDETIINDIENDIKKICDTIWQ